MEPNIDARLSAIEKKLDQVANVVTSMRRAQKTAAAMRWLYWLIIIGIGVASFYLVQPYLVQVGNLYGGLLGGEKSTESEGVNYSELFNQLKEFQANQ